MPFKKYKKRAVCGIKQRAHGGRISTICRKQGRYCCLYEKCGVACCKIRGNIQQYFPGGVLTSLNDRVITNPDLWNKIMQQTLIPKWATVEEIAEWAYFVTVINKSMTAQDILIDNGEDAKAEFVW